MTVQQKNSVSEQRTRVTALHRYLPFTDWLLHYRPEDWAGDLLAGTIVAVMLVPQSMAYALLAGLPPQIGLYASILPLILYALLGTSRSLAVGPVAIDSLIVASGLSAVAAKGTSDYLALASLLALMVGALQFGMGLLRFGFVVNFLSHPVISGFTSAAALLIGFGQLKHLLGLSFPRTESFAGLVKTLFEHFPETNLFTLSIGLVSLAILGFFNYRLGSLLAKQNLQPKIIVPICKSGPLAVVLVATFLVSLLGLSEWADVATVGTIPRGLPSFTLPTLGRQDLRDLLPTAFALGFVGFVESIAMAKSLASKRRQRIDTNQEFIGLGVANLGAAFTGGYPVTGGLSRSVVNFSAGANTGLASIVSALWVALTVVFLTPLLFYLPNASLAAIILVAIANLFDVKTLRETWRYNKQDALALLVMFVAVLATGVVFGIVLGILAAIVLYLWRTSRPHMAVVGRVGNSEHFRNVLRHDVKTEPHILTLRVDESLCFANAKFLEARLREIVSEHPELQHIVLVCSGINFIDASALDSLKRLVEDFREAGIQFHLAEVKGPVMDKLLAVRFPEQLGEDRIFLTTHHAIQALTNRSPSAS